MNVPVVFPHMNTEWLQWSSAVAVLRNLEPKAKAGMGPSALVCTGEPRKYLLCGLVSCTGVPWLLISCPQLWCLMRWFCHLERRNSTNKKKQYQRNEILFNCSLLYPAFYHFSLGRYCPSLWAGSGCLCSSVWVSVRAGGTKTQLENKSNKLK